MGNKTQIQWCDATWNVGVGCSKIDRDCLNCYMFRDSLNEKRYNPRVVRKTKTVFTMPLKYKPTTSEVWDGRPLIFTSSLTDFYHKDIDLFREEAFEIIRKCPHLIFQILTKRPERIIEHTPEDILNADNVWFGTSVGAPEGMKRIYDLMGIPCKTRFVSFEPLHQRVDMNLDILDLMKIHWAIIGGESGNENGKSKYRPCQVEWMEELVEDLRPTTSIFIKQMGTYLSKQLKMSDRHGTKIEEFPKQLRIREFPSVFV